MKNSEILKRLFRDYTRKFLDKLVIALIFSLILAGSTSSIAYLLDPAIEKIFLNKDQSLILIIPFLIMIAFAAKGITLWYSYNHKSLWRNWKALNRYDEVVKKRH